MKKFNKKWALILAEFVLLMMIVMGGTLTKEMSWVQTLATYVLAFLFGWTGTLKIGESEE